MSTKKTTTTTNKYDPSSMTFFQSLQPQLQEGYKADLNIDPTKSPVFNLALQSALKNVQGLNRTTMSNLSTNALFRSGTNFGGMQESLLANAGRNATANKANAFLQNYINYDTMRRQEQMQASGIKPLQTGQTTTQQTSGLGTWLPQFIGAGAQIGMAALTGGSSAAMKVAGGAIGNAAMQTAQGNAGDPGLAVPNLQWNENPFNMAASSRASNGSGFGSSFMRS